MTHPETAISGLFDHEQEDLPRQGRERPAPDWGGDELFSSTPRRRRRLDPEQARRAAAERHRQRDTGEHHLHPVPEHDDWSALRARANAHGAAEHPTAELASARPTPAVAPPLALNTDEIEFREIAPA